LRIVFLGTPEFSVSSLDAIIKAGFNVVAVVTAPDKPAGRGMKMQASAVKQYAVAHNIPVLQPAKLKDPVFIEELKSYQADLQVVIAFRMLPEAVWSMPNLGTVNLHASLLPDYRGAAPINWAIINGETETGVSTFLLKHQIDTGDIILSKSVNITPTMNAGELHDLLKEVGAEVMVDTLKAIESENYKPTPQRSDSIKNAPKIFTEDCIIDWNQKSVDIYNKIRGLSPYPGAISHIKDKLIKIYKANYSIESSSLNVGDLDTNLKNMLRFRTLDGFIYIEEIQAEGKKRMLISEFLNGNKSLF
jgi:methionyl-tRNA formyltransferase